MNEQANFQLGRVNGFPLVNVAGEIDLTNVEKLESILENAAEMDAGVIIVSLQDASYFDSRTIHALLRFADRLRTNRQRLMIVAPRDGSPAKILEIAGITDALPTFDSVDQAAAAGSQAVAGPQ